MKSELLPLTVIAVDWNGTMVNDALRAWQSTTKSLRELGLQSCDPGSLAGFRSRFSLPMEKFFADLGVPEPLLAECVNLWNAEMLEISADLAPGAEHLLHSAKALGIPVVVISGAHEHVIWNDCKNHGVTHLIAEVHGSVHPKREILKRYASRGPIAYIGDTRYDVAEGLAAGAATVAVDFGYGDGTGLEDADEVVSDLTDLLQLLGIPA